MLLGHAEALIFGVPVPQLMGGFPQYFKKKLSYIQIVDWGIHWPSFINNRIVGENMPKGLAKLTSVVIQWLWYMQVTQEVLQNFTVWLNSDVLGYFVTQILCVSCWVRFLVYFVMVNKFELCFIKKLSPLGKVEQRTLIREVVCWQAFCDVAVRVARGSRKAFQHCFLPCLLCLNWSQILAFQALHLECHRFSSLEEE